MRDTTGATPSKRVTPGATVSEGVAPVFTI